MRSTGSVGASTSIQDLTESPKIPTWFVVWFAPTPRSSIGRSAVSKINGTPLWLASKTAGNKLATAVPDVVIMATGLPLALAAPRAVNAIERSSMRTRSTSLLASWSCCAAMANDCDLEPGARNTSSTPSSDSAARRFAEKT